MLPPYSSDFVLSMNRIRFPRRDSSKPATTSDTFDVSATSSAETSTITGGGVHRRRADDEWNVKWRKCAEKIELLRASFRAQTRRRMVTLDSRRVAVTSQPWARPPAMVDPYLG
jgi:hypothetical protein